MASCIAGALCLDFSNSLTGLITTDYKSFPTPYGRLAAWCEDYGALPSDRAGLLVAEAEGNPPSAAAVLRRAQALGGAIHGIFLARAQNQTPSSGEMDTLNKELSTALRQARVILAGDRACWGWKDDPRSLDQILWPVAHSAAELLVSEEAVRVRVCAQDTCDWLFVDTSKNRRRRWCDMKTCGNRAKVRRFREKQLEV